MEGNMEAGKLREMDEGNSTKYFVEFLGEEKEGNKEQVEKKEMTARSVKCMWKVAAAFRNLNLKRKNEMEWEVLNVMKKRTDEKIEGVLRRKGSLKETLKRQKCLWLASTNNQGIMKALSWNCQGIGSTLAVDALKEHKKNYDPNIIFLMETRNRKEAMEKVRKKVKFENSYYIDLDGMSGGLALCLNKECQSEGD
ncbi:hypothetical protein CRYUN_Cryun34aG0093900 [Craigia yunnanensis]